MSMCIDHYRTSDLPLTATLLHEGFEVETVDRSKSACEFVFPDSPELRETIQQYWQNRLRCPAQSLLSSFKRAKHLLYDGQM